MPARRPLSNTPARAAGEVHWHIARLVVDADPLGGVSAGAIDAALNTALAHRLAGARAAVPPRGETPFIGAVADALAAQLPPTVRPEKAGTQPR